VSIVDGKMDAADTIKYDKYGKVTGKYYCQSGFCTFPPQGRRALLQQSSVCVECGPDAYCPGGFQTLGEPNRVACPTPAIGSNVAAFTTGNVTTASSRDQCLAECNDRSVLNATANACTACTTPPNCATPGAACFGSSSQLTCTACAVGFALDAAANTCTACTTLPADCGNGNGTCFGATTQQTCAACNGGFALDATANTCTACTTLPADCDSGDGTCFGATTQQTCSTCQTGFALDATANTCTACTTPPNCATPGAACSGSSSQLACTTCAAGFALNATANTCTAFTTTTANGTITLAAGFDDLQLTSFDAQCPTNQIAVGFGVSLEVRGFVWTFNVQCATLDAAAATYGTPMTYGPAATFGSVLCPAGEQMTGIIAATGEILDRLGAICRPIVWTDTSASSTLGPLPAGETYRNESCPVGQVITGLSGRTINYYGAETASAVVATCSQISANS
jgi:hypothetical protein